MQLNVRYNLFTRIDSRSSPEIRKRPGCVPERADKHSRCWQRKIERESARGTYRKWYNIAAGKDAESGPQLHGGRPTRRDATLRLSFLEGGRGTLLAPCARLQSRDYSRFRNNNYLIPEAHTQPGWNAGLPTGGGKREGPVPFRSISWRRRLPRAESNKTRKNGIPTRLQFSIQRANSKSIDIVIDIALSWFDRMF